MYLLVIFFTLLMGLAVGWSIGANDAANSLGVAVGSRILTLRQAIVLIAVFGFLGAYLQGAYVIKTIGKGIVPMDSLDKNVSLYFAMVASFAACVWVVIATSWKMPISTSHSIVGAVAGAALLGYIFYRVFKNLLYRIIPRRFLQKSLVALVIVSGCYVAYSWGGK